MNRIEKLVVAAVALGCSTPAWAFAKVAPSPETDLSIAAVAVMVVGYVWMRRKVKLLRG